MLLSILLPALLVTITLTLFVLIMALALPFSVLTIVFDATSLIGFAMLFSLATS